MKRMRMMVMTMETGLPCFLFVVAHQDLHAACGMMTLNLHPYCFETMVHPLNQCSNYHLKLTLPPRTLWLSPGLWWILDNAIFGAFQFSSVNPFSFSSSELWKHTEIMLSFSSSSFSRQVATKVVAIIMVMQIINMINVCLLILSCS